VQPGVGARAWAAARSTPFVVGGGGVICALSFLLFLAALSSGGAGAVLTLRNTSVAFAQIFGLFLGERPGLSRLLGASLVLVGAVVLGWPR
jgi:uncharacterized membrane protein